MRISDWSSDVCSSDLIWQDAASGRRFTVENPATEHTLAEVAEGGERDVDAAVAAARAAFTGVWAQQSPAQRGLLLFRLAELLDQHREELAQLITLENGKPIAAARGEAASARSEEHKSELQSLMRISY